MKNYFPSYIRVPLIFFGVAGLLEYVIDSGDMPAFVKHPEVLGVLLLLLFVLIAFEVSYAAIGSLLHKVLPEDEKAKLEAAKDEQPVWVQNLLKKLTRSKKIEQEQDIVLTHNYDGIRELDNVLPPWWVYLFYASIVFAIIYAVRFSMNDLNQIEEYNTEVVEAKAAFEEWKKTAKDYVDVSSVTVLTEKADLVAGKQVYTQNCAVCHKADGGGSIGPNLTDDKWILGGGVKNVFTTISKGGRPNKGMEAWAKKGLKAQQIQQVASYILSLQGTNPAGGKAPEGEVWKGE